MDTNKPKGLLSLHHMIGFDDCQTQDDLGVWVRAVPLPFYPGVFARIVQAWWVIVGRAYPVIWPEPGDLERALGTYRVSKPGNDND